MKIDKILFGVQSEKNKVKQKRQNQEKQKIYDGLNLKKKKVIDVTNLFQTNQQKQNNDKNNLFARINMRRNKLDQAKKTKLRQHNA